MALTRAAVAQLYTPIYDEFMLQTWDEESQTHPKIFQTIEDSSRQYLWDGLSGLGVWVAAPEGGGGGYEDPVLGYPKTFTQAKFWKKFQVSYEAVDQDEYALLDKEDDAQQMGRGARAKVEIDTATILFNGFAVACPDGQFLFSHIHPQNPQATTTLYDNLLAGPFSHDNLELAETQIARNFFDPKGIPIEVTKNPIIAYPPALRGVVHRVLDARALERPGTPNRDINRFAVSYEPIEWRYLMASMGGSDTAWYIIFKELNLLKIIWSAKPHFTGWVDEDNEFYKFKGRMLYDTGAVDWRCAFASTGL
jgi:hypothetical protein